MCGIVGYIGIKKESSVELGLEALKRLEYRGYDSAGLAVFDDVQRKIFALKAVGRIVNLEEKFGRTKAQGCPVILHTRWATHGNVTEQNAHPHHDCKENIYLVHNGIIENFKSLKNNLEKEGHRFYSQTDTEVLCHLVEKFFEERLEQAVRRALSLVEGTYALVIIAKADPGKLVVARKSSPLLIGIGGGEFIVASDPAAIVSHTKKAVYLEDGEMAVLTPREFALSTIAEGKQIQRQYAELDWTWEEASKGGFPHYMLKEIHEAPATIENALRGRLRNVVQNGILGGLESIIDQLKKIERIIISSSGSSYYASLVGEYMLEEYGGVPTEVEHSSELRYRNRKPVFDASTCLLTVSQSGETADALAALRNIKKQNILTMSMVNVVGSSIARETGVGLYNYAGPEIGVASTKTFISQLVVFALLALFFAKQRSRISQKELEHIAEELEILPKKAEMVLQRAKDIEIIARKYADYDHMLYIGRKYNYPIALEGALKLKEISYVHAEGYGAGEMKHGPIALIDEEFPTVAIVPSDSVYEKMISNIMEIKARRGKVIALATDGNQEIKEIANDVIYIPQTLEMLTPILSVIPLQLFAYSVGVLRGCDVDKPRNLAKSVTVE